MTGRDIDNPRLLQVLQEQPCHAINLLGNRSFFFPFGPSSLINKPISQQIDARRDKVVPRAKRGIPVCLILRAWIPQDRLTLRSRCQQICLVESCTPIINIRQTGILTSQVLSLFLLSNRCLMKGMKDQRDEWMTD